MIENLEEKADQLLNGSVVLDRLKALRIALGMFTLGASIPLMFQGNIGSALLVCLSVYLFLVATRKRVEKVKTPSVLPVLSEGQPDP